MQVKLDENLPTQLKYLFTDFGHDAVTVLDVSARDISRTLPKLDPCGFTGTLIRVRLKYGLSIDRREKRRLRQPWAGLTVTMLPDTVEALADSLTQNPSISETTTTTEDYLPRSQAERNRLGGEQPPGLRLHAGGRRRRLGLREIAAKGGSR